MHVAALLYPCVHKVLLCDGLLRASHEGNSIIMRNGFHGDDAEEEIEVYVAAVDTLEPPGTFCMVTQSTSFHITGYVVGVRCALCGIRCVVWWCVRALV